MKEFAVYKGDNLLVIGTQQECARNLNVKLETIYYYTTDAYRRKLEKRKNKNN